MSHVETVRKVYKVLGINRRAANKQTKKAVETIARVLRDVRPVQLCRGCEVRAG
jgi:hypothetical protein